jgi:beta-glucosidase
MFTAQFNTIYEALAAKFGAANVRLEQGVTYDERGAYYDENPPEIAKAVAAARGVDVIVACIGENSYCETPGNLSDLALSANQSDLVKALAATGKPVILVLNGGRPRIIADIEPLADAVVDILLPGNFGGDALANILAGDVNPSAKMPYTYPRYSAALTTYDYRVSEEADTMEGAYDYNAVVSVQWPFGFGLSYTTFEYSNFQSANTSFGAGDELSFLVDVTNTGARAGKEVVMLFSSDLISSIVPEGRRLRAFEKVELQPGETRTVELKIKASDLAFVGADGHWVLEQGAFRMQTGNQTLVVTCDATHKWDSPNK